MKAAKDKHARRWHLPLQSGCIMIKECQQKKAMGTIFLLHTCQSWSNKYSWAVVPEKVDQKRGQLLYPECVAGKEGFYCPLQSCFTLPCLPAVLLMYLLHHTILLLLNVQLLQKALKKKNGSSERTEESRSFLVQQFTVYTDNLLSSLRDDKLHRQGEDSMPRMSASESSLWLPSSPLTKSDVCSQVNIQSRYTFLSASPFWHFNRSKWSTKQSGTFL